MNKFIFVSGGVCSSLGKGVAASCLGALLEGRGLNIRMVKCDPYINVNAGTMNPFVHGEVYVTDDGAETDLDLGNYARFTKGCLSKANSMTTGQVYQSVMEKERAGFYQGSCIQVIPHITDEIKNRILKVANEDADTDVVIVEIGGTVGDIESIPFLEAARQIIHKEGRANAISVHLTLIPEVAGGELKTKPTQHSVKAMQEMGIQPDVLICRAPVMLDRDTLQKIAQFTNVDPDAVFTSRDIDTTIYEIPLMFFFFYLDQVVLKKLGVTIRHADLKPWYSMMDKYRARQGKVRIAVVGEYIELQDAYKSVYEALFHTSVECGVEVELVKVNSSGLGKDKNPVPSSIDGAPSVDGVLIHGGMDEREIEGMIRAAAWARVNKIPCFGICLGMQVMAVEWCRNVLGWADANSVEFNRNAGHPVFSLPEGAMRLGQFESVAQAGTRVHAAYNEARFWERHRHRCEFNGSYLSDISASGLIISGTAPGGALVDCIEWPDHPWGVGVQFNSELKSKPTAAAPLFRDFIKVCQKISNEK
jgi:CTP synthase